MPAESHNHMYSVSIAYIFLLILLHLRLIHEYSTISCGFLFRYSSPLSRNLRHCHEVGIKNTEWRKIKLNINLRCKFIEAFEKVYFKVGKRKKEVKWTTSLLDQRVFHYSIFFGIFLYCHTASSDFFFIHTIQVYIVYHWIKSYWIKWI